MIQTLSRGVARIFQRGGGRVSEATHQIVSRIIAAWRPILTKDESRWRKYFTKKHILKKWAFQQWLLRPRYCHGVFVTWILWVVCSKEGLPRGVTGTPGPPPPRPATPLLSTVMQLFRGPYFSVGAASRHFWPNSAITNSTTHVFHNLWVLFHLLQG